MELNIHLENFDGPMDLLLHLVKETKLDIYEINMSTVIESYLNYIHTLQELNIDVGGEFLLMASSLLHLKSKMLIGKTEETESEDEYEYASEEDLKQKIIDYEKYKNITKELQELELKRQDIYTKVPESMASYIDEPELINTGLSIEDLVKALENVAIRLHYKEPINTRITRREISVKKQVENIRRFLSIKKHCYFEELFEIPEKNYIIATFLAILEMAKEKEIGLYQPNAESPIEVEMI